MRETEADTPQPYIDTVVPIVFNVTLEIRSVYFKIV